jgi:hypothetical protein
MLALLAIVAGASGAGAEEGRPDLTRNGQIVLEPSVPAPSAKIREAARAAGGQLVSESAEDVVVSVPVTGYETFRKALTSIGRIRSELLGTQDITDQLVDARAQARASAASRQRLESVSPTAHDVNEHVLLEREIERATEDTTAAEARIRQLQSSTETVRVRVHLVVSEPEEIPEPKLPFPWLEQLSLSHLLDTSVQPETPSLVLRGSMDADIGLAYARARDASRFGGHPGYLALATTFRILGEANPVGFYGGYDIELGGGGGFRYGLQPLLGLGVPFGSGISVALASGPGIDGITGGVEPFAVDVPIELDVSVELIRWMSIGASLREGVVFAAPERKNGSKHAPFGDELALGINVTIGTREGSSYSADRFGPRIGFFYREIMGTPMYEGVLSFGAHHLDYSED